MGAKIPMTQKRQPKRIPKCAIAFITLLAFYVGTFGGAIPFVIAIQLEKLWVAISIYIIEILALLLSLMYLMRRYKTTLEEWGLIGKKEKAKK